MRCPLRLLAAFARDPAGWFLLGGLALLGVEAAWGRPEVDEIVIDRGHLSSRDTAPPEATAAHTGAALPPRLRAVADQEMLMREALRLGLHRSDPVLRRRMAQKMELLLEGVPPEPTDDELAAWLQDHPAPYRVPARVAFDHVFVRASPQAEARAEELLARLEAGASPEGLGAPWPHPTDGAQALPRIERSHGSAVARALAGAELGRWIEVPTAEGRHLLRPTARTPARAPKLAEVRAALRRDWQDAWRERHRRARLQELRARYPVRLVGAEP